ncbi:MAG TPA: hypothetical protein VNZ62_06345 [Capillimicrobium sp.]|nr:hypothetical protein [Capillimicrobium sp.]
MATHTDPRLESTYGSAVDADRGSGWLAFAAVMFLVGGALNVLYGIVALANDDHFAVDELLFGDLSMWGVLYLCFGGAQLLAGGLVLRRSMVGAVLGIGIAVLHAMLVLLSIGVYPVWSIIALTIDGLIIYALTVHGFDEA